MGRYFSDELFHFVGHARPDDDEANYRTLALVLRKSCISHPPHLDTWGTTSITFNWGAALRDGMIVPTVVCFADIPSEHLSLHASKYGRFGVSLRKDLLTRYGAMRISAMVTAHFRIIVTGNSECSEAR